MNEIKQPDTGLPGNEKASVTGAGLLRNAAQGAQNTMEHLADSAAPVVRKFGETVAAAEEALHAKTDQLRETRDAWVGCMRSSVRGKPLLSVLAALVLGVVVTRIIRPKR